MYFGPHCGFLFFFVFVSFFLFIYNYVQKEHTEKYALNYSSYIRTTVQGSYITKTITYNS